MSSTDRPKDGNQGKRETAQPAHHAIISGEGLQNGQNRWTETGGSNVGTSFTVMKLWEGRTENDLPIWLTEPPPDIIELKPIAEEPRYVITLLHRPEPVIGRQRLDTIIMRGPTLRKFLDEIIPNVAAFYNESEQGIAIRAPFRLLFWHLEQIDMAAKDRTDEKLSKVATLLLEVLQAEFSDLLNRRENMVASGEINFDTLWTIFKPGITCLTPYANSLMAVKVVAIDYNSNPMGGMYYRIKYQTLAWDGEYLGWQDAHADVMEFRGRRRIQELEIYPVGFHADPDYLKTLAARGKRFVEIAVKEPYMMSFSGEALDREVSPMWWQGEQKKKMSERVVLDARAYNHYFRRIYVSKWKTRDQVSRELSTGAVDDATLIYCCPEFYCFALQHKKWGKVWLDNMEEVVFNETAYASLVLPNDYKQLLLAFAEAQIDGVGFDDVIAGKGQGILMLLAGPPGTGKTLTAEAVSEHMRRPLYSVSAGELGASAGGMENALDKVLELSTRWNAVLLIDEADVFLERRHDNDLQRNSIVSVFLRKLEYYRGIMFLTTNRFHSFDEAFKSRIHIAIRYPDLDSSARRSIWENFLAKTREIYGPGVDVTPAELDQLQTKALNGREIRNIVKSAQLLASRARAPLNKTHLDIVWKVEHEDSVWSNDSNE